MLLFKRNILDTDKLPVVVAVVLLVVGVVAAAPPSPLLPVFSGLNSIDWLNSLVNELIFCKSRDKSLVWNCFR